MLHPLFSGLFVFQALSLDTQSVRSATEKVLVFWSMYGQFLYRTMPGPTQVTLNGSLVRWEADFGRINGKRKRRYFKTKGQAQEALRMFAEETKENGRVWAQLSPKKRASAVAILKDMSAHGVTLADVWAYYKDRHKPNSGRSLGGVRDEFLRSKEDSGVSLRYLEQLKVYLRLFCLDREEIDISDVDHLMIEEWLKSRKEAPATRQTGINRLSALFSFCIRRGYLESNPLKRVERVRVPHIDPEILTIDECQRLVNAAAKSDKGMLTYLGLALFCGIRPDEALRIDTKEIDLERGLIFLKAEKSKVRNRRIVTLTKPAIQCIQEGGAVPKKNFKRRFDKLRKDAKIEKWPHDALRKTAASHFYNVYGIEKATEQLGHSAGVLLRVYRELVSEEETKLWLAISHGQ